MEAKNLRGLRAFFEDYPGARAQLYRGSDRLRMGGIWCLPVEEFLRRLMPERGLLDWLGADSCCGEFDGRERWRLRSIT